MSYKNENEVHHIKMIYVFIYLFIFFFFADIYSIF